MRLVNYSEDPKNEYFLNMDLITGVWYDGKEYHASFVIASDAIISESAYNTILKYGAAKV